MTITATIDMTSNDRTLALVVDGSAHDAMWSSEGGCIMGGEISDAQRNRLSEMLEQQIRARLNVRPSLRQPTVTASVVA